MKKLGFAVFIIWQCLFAAFALASAPLWKIVPARSSLTFIATQNGAPVKGEFKKFTGDIHFDLKDLQNSKVKITVDMNSLATSYQELTITLKAADWFDMSVFPQAVFESSEIVQTGDGKYEARGTLTIRDHSQPVTLTFTANQPTGNSALVTGYTTLQRSAFGVGRGEWASVKEIKDDVRVDFVVSAAK